MALARERRCSPMRLLIRFGRRTEGVQGASEKPLLVSPHASFAEGESLLGV